MTNEFRPPAGIPTKSEFGNYMESGLYDAKCTEARWNEKAPANCWIGFTLTEYPDAGRFSLNLYTPRDKEVLNNEAYKLVAEGKIPEDMPKDKVRERVLKSFFRFGESMAIAGIDYTKMSADEAVQQLVGWKGKIELENRPGFNTSVKRILSAREVSTIQKPQLIDVPF